MEKAADVLIVGAGISGLNAAWHLHQAGKKVVVLEASDKAGGRMRSDRSGDFVFDRGFQVLLTAYPEFNRKDFPVPMAGLPLHRFLPGAIIFHQGKRYLFGDPLRMPSALAPTLMNPLLSLGDLWKTFRLRQELMRTSPEACFDDTLPNAATYLQQRGFSSSYINSFFRPFFEGIFLDDPVNVDASAFRFIYKMFAEGYAALPAGGIQALPDAMQRALPLGTIRTGMEVTAVTENSVSCANGDVFHAPSVLLTGGFDRFLPQQSGIRQTWRPVLNVYFAADVNPLPQPILCLQPDREALVGNFTFLSAVAPGYAPSGKHLLSATHTGGQAWSETLGEKMRMELASLLGMAPEQLHYLHHYSIPRALPTQERISYAPRVQRSDNGIWLAGDACANSSANAALLSGRLAAAAIAAS